MNPVSEVAPGAQTNSSSQSQSALIASVVAQQKVIAAQSSDASGNAGNNTSRDENPTPVKSMQTASEKAQKMLRETAKNDAQARSVVEAQESSAEDRKINAAFAARLEMNQLLSVIRDPEDRVLPQDPEDLAV